ncbi:MAG: glycosyltransferase [Chitinophagaceae bacterium]|nr:glycosyltransferase [Chitinophagaceae bacterium]
MHIPSRTGIKGTSFILEALEALKKENIQFEFEFISGVPNEIVLEKLQDADILVDEIYLHGPGTLSLEGIASGCAVATKTIKGEAYEDVICNIDLDNLKEKIKRLIQDMDYRVRLATEGRKLIESINDPIRIVGNILEKIVDPSTVSNDYDYCPTFFSEKYQLNEGVDISFKNKQLTKKIVEEFKLAGGLNIKRMQKEGLI